MTLIYPLITILLKRAESQAFDIFHRSSSSDHARERAGSKPAFNAIELGHSSVENISQRLRRVNGITIL